MECGDGVGYAREVGDGNSGSMRKRLKERATAGSCGGEGAYDIQHTFSLRRSLGITPLIRIRTNSNIYAGEVGRARSEYKLERLDGMGGGRELCYMAKSEHQANQKEWSERARFGPWRLAEIVISAFEHVFGEARRASCRTPPTSRSPPG